MPQRINRVPRTLYRQLLSWCRQYKDVPFDGVPPLTLTPPQVNSRALQRLRSMRSFLDSNQIKDSATSRWSHPAHFAVYNSNVSVDDNMIVFPAVHDANELKDVIRSVFWLNNASTTSNTESLDKNKREQAFSSEDEKEQIALAFDAIKSCNQLSSSELDSRRNKRQVSIEIRSNESEDALNVKYHVGQVIQQKNLGWRGVIVGWNVENDQTKQSNRLSSLTTKQYSLPGSNEESADKQSTETKFNIKYTVLVDVNDASLAKSSKIVSLESQEDIVLVEPR